MAKGNDRATNVRRTKAEAETTGRGMARDRGVEHAIKNKDGSIGKGSISKQSYGHDTSPPRG